MESNRLRFAPLAAEDFLALIDGPETFRGRFGLPAAEGLRDFIVSDDVSQEFTDMLHASSGQDPWTWGFAVIDVETEQVVGTAGLKGPPDAEGTAEIAYGIVPSFENRGYATEAAGELVRFAKADDRVRTVLAHTLPETNASTRVLEKNGFEKVGAVTDPDDGEVWRWRHVG